MKKVVNREETVKQISVAYPDFHTIATEPDVTVLGTALADNVTRSICIIKTEEVGFAMQKLSEQGQFITQFVPISALMLSKVVFSEIEEPVVEEKAAKK